MWALSALCEDFSSQGIRPVLHHHEAYLAFSLLVATEEAAQCGRSSCQGAQCTESQRYCAALLRRVGSAIPFLAALAHHAPFCLYLLTY